MLEAWGGFYCLSSPGAEFARGEVDFENFGDGRRDLAHSDDSEIAMNGDVGPISMNVAHRSHNDMSGHVCTSPPYLCVSARRDTTFAGAAGAVWFALANGGSFFAAKRA